MGELYNNSHEVHSQAYSGTAPADGSTITTLDSSVDEPPIRGAGSSHGLTEKSGGETRCIEKLPTIEVKNDPDQDDIAVCAHTLTGIEVAQRLQTDAE